MIFALVTGRGRFAAVLFLWHFAISETQAIRGTQAPQLHRYASLMVLFLLPGAAQMVAEAARRARWTRRRAVISAAVMGMILSAISLPYLGRVKEQSLWQTDGLAAARALRGALRPSDRVVLGGELHPAIVVESGGRRGQFYQFGPLNPNGSEADLETMVAEYQPAYVVAYAYDSGFAALELEDKGCRELSIAGADYQPANHHGLWCLLRRVSPPS
ncbi:MAG: hypothetical protein M5R36_03400 [Deltaproteobacteria bacterium]|nr:hypothetical protein [Deltaproteobacteria bacterium]